jgi:transglutaminase-like putative cysteine protease/predicted glutamine amidotransferase
MSDESPGSPPATSPKGPEVKLVEHQMTRLMALSFDGPASPSLTLKAIKQTEERDTPYGWGLAWYPAQRSCAMLLKDPTSIGENAMTKLLSDWERFESTVFLCHLRGAARSLQEEDTHPFSRSYAGRDWVLAHNGDLFADLHKELPLGDDPRFEPVGSTDSEHAFCWLLARFHEARARRLSDLGWPMLMSYFRRLDALGTANFMLTDGLDMVIYRDESSYNGLHWARFTPPHRELHLETDDVLIDLDDAVDRSRTIFMVVTRPLETGTWTPLLPGQMLVIRRGTLIFDSLADAAARERIVEPVPRVPEPPPSTKSGRMLLIPQARIESGMQLPGRGGATPQVTSPMPSPDDPLLFDPASVSLNFSTPAPPPPTASPRPSRPPTLSSPFLPSDRSLALPGTRLLSVVHDTVYRYKNPVERSSHLYRLKPVHDGTQEVLAQELTFSVDGLRRDYEDVFNNQATSLELDTSYAELRIVSRSLVRLSHAPSPRLHSPTRRVTLPLVWMPWQRQMMLPYLLPPELPETQLRELYEYAMTFVARQDGDLVQTLMDMNLTIYRDFRYVTGSTTLETTPFDVYCNRRGVCQDFANLLICLARLLSIPARYRVGYIYTGGAYENKIQSDASHAWLELYLPWLGWQGFDPTNGCLVGKDHVRIACGRNYRDATPTSGTIYKGGGPETLSVDVKVIDVTG